MNDSDAERQNQRITDLELRIAMLEFVASKLIALSGERALFQSALAAQTVIAEADLGVKFTESSKRLLKLIGHPPDAPA